MLCDPSTLLIEKTFPIIDLLLELFFCFDMVVLELIADLFQSLQVFNRGFQFVDFFLMAHILVRKLLDHFFSAKGSLQLLFEILDIVFRR